MDIIIYNSRSIIRSINQSINQLSFLAVFICFLCIWGGGPEMKMWKWFYSKPKITTVFKSLLTGNILFYKNKNVLRLSLERNKMTIGKKRRQEKNNKILKA